MMTPENQKKFDEKEKRMRDALSLKEPDRVPIELAGGQFMVNYAGFTMADVIYDTSLEKIKFAIKKYLHDFDPDVVTEVALYYFGEGPGHELQGSKTMLISGQDDEKIGRDSIHQYLEFPTLLDDEFDEFFADRTGFMLNKYMPRISTVLEPFEKLKISAAFRSPVEIANIVSQPDFRKSIEQLWKLADFYKEFYAKTAAANRELMDLGYPSFSGGGAGVPFDKYSDTFRGTILSLMDLYDHEEEVSRFIEEFQQFQLASIKKMNPDGSKNGKYISLMLHKGVDGFMNGEQYRKYYWRHMQEIAEAIISVNMIPVFFCEGKYNSRLDFLTEVPKGKVYYYFEDVDMAQVKKKLGGIACIGGNFPSALLIYGKKEKVIDECKKLLDTCAPGGGYIFKTSSVLSGAKPENVEAMFDTVKQYGKY